MRSFRLPSLIVCKKQNTQFDSVETFQSCVTRLFYRTLLQVIICDSFPAEFSWIDWLIIRTDPLEFPVGKLPFRFGETRFSDYVLSYFASKHPEFTAPTAESLEKTWRESQRLFSLFKGMFVIQNLYPFGLTALFLNTYAGSVIGNVDHCRSSVLFTKTWSKCQGGVCI